MANRTQVLRNIALCFLSAILLIFSFPRFNLELLAWFGFIPLFLAARGKGRFKSFLLFYFAGVIFWWGIIYWLANVTFLGTFVLVFYLASYFGIFGIIFSASDRLPAACRLFLLPSVWVLLEYVRAHLFTGFPWALLGYSQYLNLPVIQIVDITGAWGVSFIIMLVNCVIAGIVGHKVTCLAGRRAKSQSRKEKIQYGYVLAACGLLFLIYGYGFYRLQSFTAVRLASAVKVAVIQGNIPQELKWDPSARNYIMNKYIRLTEKAAEDNPDLIIWPEAAMPVIPQEEPAFFGKAEDAAKSVKICILLGAVTEDDDSYYNSALLLSLEGRVLFDYRKIHLVPFGEYIPLRRYLPFLETIAPIGDVTAGKDYVIFEDLPTRASGFGVLICFEDLFPELSRTFVQKGARYLINITNDAWYKRTSAAYQHLQASVFRAVENRVNIARAANTGVSGFIEPSGKITAAVKDNLGNQIFVDGYCAQNISLIKREQTFYTRYGDVFVVICLLTAILGTLLCKPRRNF